MKVLSSILLVIILCSCTSNVLEKPSISYNQMEQCDNLYDLFGSNNYELIPLQIDSLSVPFIGMKLAVYNNYFALGDKFYEHTIFMYDHGGRFCRKIGKRGNGDAEYPTFKDFSIWNDTISIASVGSPGDCFYQYNLNGDFIDKREIPERVVSFARNSEGEYLINSGRNVYNSLWQLTYYSPNLKQISQFIELEKDDNNIPTYEDNFSVGGDCFYFHEAFNNQLYVFNEEGMKPSYYLDFGDKNNFEDIQHGDFIKSIERLQKQGFYMLHSYVETDAAVCIVLNYLKDGETKKQSVLIYNKTEERGNVLELHDPELYIGNICIENNILYCMVSNKFIEEIMRDSVSTDTDVYILKSVL